MDNSSRKNPHVIVIGAGMTGILATIRLRRAGISDITVLEKAGNLGGTWRENTYPNVACDIPSHMYTYLEKAGELMVWPFTWAQYCKEMAKPDLRHCVGVSA